MLSVRKSRKNSPERPRDIAVLLKGRGFVEIQGEDATHMHARPGLQGKFGLYRYAPHPAVLVEITLACDEMGKLWVKQEAVDLSRSGLERNKSIKIEAWADKFNPHAHILNNRVEATRRRRL